MNGEYIWKMITLNHLFAMIVKWVMDGNAILFHNERFGMRNHASWGSEDDAFLVFVNQDAYDKYRLSEEDYKILKEAEEANKKNAKKPEGKNDPLYR